MKKAITLILILAIAFALACINDPKPAETTPLPTTPASPTESPTEAPTATPEPTPLPSTLTYEERLAQPKIPLPPHWSFMNSIASDLESTYAKYGEDGFIALCEILSVKFYIGWNAYEGPSLYAGHSETEARVIEVPEEYNNAGIKPGDIITFKSYSYIIPIPMWVMYPIFSEELNTPIENKDDLIEVMENVSEFEIEYPVERGRDYRYYIDYYDFPMKEGERYTLMGNNRVESNLFYASLIYPESYELDVAAFAKEHDFIYDDYQYLSIAKEIAALFRDPA